MDVLTLLKIALVLWILLAGLMTVAWVIEQRTGNSGWIDVVWTLSVGLVGIAGAVVPSFNELSLRNILVASLVAVWALRLAGYIAWRTARISDDPRYAKLRAQWADKASQNMFWLLQAQAALSIPMVLSIVLAAHNPAPLFTVLDGIAVFLFMVALAGSASADAQLSRFKKLRPAPGTICDSGLWAWSRHPNYFFEWLVWMSIALIAINVSGDWPLGYAALAGPTCMYLLLRYVSGVPPLEEHMLAKYGAAYTDYQRTTSVFFPFPPSVASR